ncbi:MAG: superinfection immunity protein [Pseudomonadota bacterium]
MLTLIAILYCLPTLAALVRGTRGFYSLWLLNLLTGWTGIGWLACLAWGLAAPRVRTPAEGC